MKKILLVLILCVNLHPKEITVAVAANVSYAIDELKREFEKNHPGIQVREILGSSGKLSAQIKNGAPYGVFMSADTAYPERLYDEGLGAEKPKTYARGALAILSTKKRDMSKKFDIFSESDIRRIAIPNPKTAPYGKAAFQALKKSDIYEKIKKKLVFAESVSQTVAYTVTAADIGIVAKSSLYSPKMSSYKKEVNWTDVNGSLYKAIDQGILLLKYGEKDPDYRAFYDFILSEKAKKIFTRYGYMIP